VKGETKAAQLDSIRIAIQMKDFLEIRDFSPRSIQANPMRSLAFSNFCCLSQNRIAQTRINVTCVCVPSLDILLLSQRKKNSLVAQNVRHRPLYSLNSLRSLVERPKCAPHSLAELLNSLSTS